MARRLVYRTRSSYADNAGWLDNRSIDHSDAQLSKYTAPVSISNGTKPLAFLSCVCRVSLQGQSCLSKQVNRIFGHSFIQGVKNVEPVYPLPLARA